ncbi:hypothetical protein ACJMK2_009171 [Sinanodonta woodiana]|uniref:C2H2-type domain-containing protein n=1 Tax=Sinanodonta woodiana TaxID=1069815 RepID=A0ABD3VEE7_SINWO
METDSVGQFLPKDTVISGFEHSEDTKNSERQNFETFTYDGAESSQNNMDSNHIYRSDQSVEEGDHRSSEEISNKCTSPNSKACKISSENLDTSANGNRANVFGERTSNNHIQTDTSSMKDVPSNARKDSKNSCSDVTSEDDRKDLDDLRNKTDEAAPEHSFMVMNNSVCQENKEHLFCDDNIVENKNLCVFSNVQDGTSYSEFEPESQHHPPASVEICGKNLTKLKIRGKVQTNDLYDNLADKGNPPAVKANLKPMETLSGTDLESSFSRTVSSETCLSDLPEVKVVLVDVMKMPIIQSFFSVDSTSDILQAQNKGKPKRCGDQGFKTISGIDSRTVSKKIAFEKNKGGQNRKANEIFNTKNKKAIRQVISEREKTGQQITSNNLNEHGPNILPSGAEQISLKRKVKTKSFLKEGARQKIMQELERVDDKKDVLNGEKRSRTRKTEKNSDLNLANWTDDHLGNSLQNDAVKEEVDLFEDSGEEYIISSEDEYLPSKEKKKSRASFVNSFSRKRRQNNKLANCSSKLKFATKGKSKRIGRPPVLGLFYCKHCDFSATEKNLILKHHARAHVQPFLSCNYCNFTCRSRSVLMEHEARKHTNEKPFKCQVVGCEYASKCKTDLDRHQSKHATEKIHKCPHCDFTTKWRRNIRHHLMTHTTDRPFSCDICGFSFKRYQDLRYHLYRHSDEKPIKCDQCGFRCKTNFELRCHQLKHSDVRQFRCSFPGCTQMTKTKSDLTKHMKIHTTERNQKCPECGKGFKTISAMKKHQQRVHTDERPYQCHICQKTFKIRIALRNHIRLHEGYKPFKCEVCGKDFANKSNMQCHLKTHSTEDRPFRCPICPYGAKIAHHLLAHIGSEHGDSYAYFCELCKKPFKRYGQLQTHYKRMHSMQELEKLGDLIPARLNVELKAEQKGSSEDIKDNEEKAVGMDLLNCIKEEPTGADKDEILQQVVAELEGSHTQSKKAAYGHRDGAETNTELQKEKRKRRGRPKKKVPDKTCINLNVGSPIVLDEGSQDIPSFTARHEGKMTGSVIVQTRYNDIDQKEDSDEKSKDKEDTNCSVDMKDDDDFVTKEDNDEVNEDTNGKTHGNVFNKMGLNQNVRDAVTSNLEMKPLKEEMKLASNVDDDKSSETSKPAATLAMYDGFRLPLATKGFEFNFEKTGKKPECWFMDPNLMNKKDAARHRAYLRKRGLTAATIRTREKNRRANPRQVALFTGFKSRHHDKYKTFDRKELMKKYFGRAADTMDEETAESLDKMNALKDEKTHLQHDITTVKEKNNVCATSINKHRSHKALAKKETNKKDIIFETLDGKNLSEEQVQQSFPLLLSQSYLSKGISSTKNKIKYSEEKKLKERKQSIDGKTKGIDVQEKERGNDNLIWKPPQKKKGKTKMSTEKGNKQNRHKRKQKKHCQSNTYKEDVDDDEENIPLSRLASVNKIGGSSAPCRTPENGQNPDCIASVVLNVKKKKRLSTQMKCRNIEAKITSAKKGPKTPSGRGLSEKRKIVEESSMKPKRKKLMSMKSDASDITKIIRTQKNGTKTKTKPCVKKLKKLKIKISLPSKKVMSSESANVASKRKKASKRTKKGCINTYSPIDNSQCVVVYPPIGVSFENTTVMIGEGKETRETDPLGKIRSVKDQTQLVLFESCIKREPDGEFLPDSSYHHFSEPEMSVQSNESKITQVIVKAEVQSAVTYPYQDLAEEWRTVQNDPMPAKSVLGGTDVALDLSGYKDATLACPTDTSSPFGSLMDQAASKDILMEDQAQDAPLDLSCRSSDNCLSREDISGTSLSEINSSDLADHELMQHQYSVVVKKEPDMEDSFFTIVSGSQQE